MSRRRDSASPPVVGIREALDLEGVQGGAPSAPRMPSSNGVDGSEMAAARDPDCAPRMLAREDAPLIAPCGVAASGRGSCIQSAGLAATSRSWMRTPSIQARIL
jgi:hypothetical protein